MAQYGPGINLQSVAMPTSQLPPSLVLAIALLSGCASATSPSTPAAAATHGASSSSTTTANATQATETAMTADPSAPPPATVKLSLELGAHAKLPDGSQIAYLELVDDSRCPPNVRCVWAGNAEIRLRWTPTGSGRSRTFTLNTSSVGGKSVTETVGAHTVRIDTLARGIGPAVTLAISRAID